MEFFNSAIEAWNFLTLQSKFCRPSWLPWAPASACGAASTCWKGMGPTTPARMLMCHKVTHKNLIDNHLLFRTKEPLMTV